MFPLLAGASATGTDSGHGNLLNSEKKEVVTDDPATLYAKLELASRNMCGSSNIQATGSIRRAKANEECYDGTLTAAVQRLDNPAVSELHQKQN